MPEMVIVVQILETRFWEKLVEGSFWENLENKLKRRGPYSLSRSPSLLCLDGNGSLRER
jgi:hypothetical protein